ncbi:MAG TPA: sugar ABC transporter permease [Terrimesophilobacter sp.]|nr:sugar ABC transporter permease [Terrimesophilobacter sp.]
MTARTRRGRGGVGLGGRAGAKPPARPARLSTNKIILLLMALPSLLVILLINVYPLLYAANQAVRRGSLIDAGPFVGADNFVDVLTDDMFWDAARFTLVFTLVGVFGSWLVGFAIALTLRSKIPAAGTFKVLLLLPWVIPVVSSAMAWNWLIATPTSPIPQLFDALGLGHPLFLANPTLAMITVCVFKVWVSFPFMMLMMSSALAGVDESVYEAGRMDGASRWQQLIHLTLPMISRPIYVSWILMTIFCVNDFTTVYLLTGGGPVGATNTLLVLAYRTVFQDMRTGPGVAIAFLMTFVLIVISVFLYRQIRKSSLQ